MIKQFLARLKFKRRLTSEEVWAAELIFVFMLTALFIAGDYLLYKNFVTDRKTTIVVAEERIISFKKGALDNANKNLRERKAFLEKPTFPVVQNPF